jgi:DNA-binding MarR family transcriptional regulator
MSEADVATELRRGAMHLVRRLRAERAPGALSGNKLLVLSHLFRHGPSTPGQIAGAEHQQPQSLTRVFAELELAGLISRARSEHDRREAVLSLTEPGRAALIGDMRDRDAWLTAALVDLSETELGVLRLAADLMDRVAVSTVAVQAETAGAA